MTERVLPLLLRMPGTYEWRGDGRIYGTVDVANNPVSRCVRLHRQNDGKMVAVTHTDASGYYNFNYLNRAYKYYVITFDHTGVYNMVGADGLVPELMTSFP